MEAIMRNFFKALALCGLLAVATPSLAQVGLQIQVTPPVARIETRPASPGSGAIWTPGFYRFDPVSQSYSWVSGSYQYPPSSRMRWVPSHYIQNNDGSYSFYTGHWATKHQAHEEREAELKRER
jgi:hypothetical protein